MQYAAPADQVVYDEDPMRVPALLKQGFVQPVGTGVATSSARIIAAGRRVACWDAFSPFIRYGPGSNQNDAIVFLHGLKSPGEGTRLFAIEFVKHPDEFNVDLVIWTPGCVGVWDPPVNATSRYTFPLSEDLINKHFRIYAGQPDVGDPSHFVIPYELDGESGTIEGWLMSSESRNLKMKVSGPAEWRPSQR